MSRHFNDIKDLLFDQPDFDDDEVPKKKSKKRRKEKVMDDKPPVETIVFRDPAKKKPKTAKKAKLENNSSTTEEFDLEKARFDVHKFGIKGFEKSKYEDARVALAVGLGAKPPSKKFINYRELKEQNKVQKVKEKEEEENARLLGDIFRKNPNEMNKSRGKSKQKRIGQGDVGAMRFSSVGKFQGGVLKINEKDISKIKQQSRPRKR